MDSVNKENVSPLAGLPLLSAKLTVEYGRGWGEKHLLNCLRLGETFHDEQIVSALRGQLNGTGAPARVFAVLP